MTGEHEERDDELEFDDGESFILEDWEELDQVLSDVEHEAGEHGDLPAIPAEDDSEEGAHHFVLDDELTGAPPGEAGSAFDQFGGLEELPADPDPEQPDDLLFHTDPGTGREARESAFTEDATDWGGDALTAEDIGIPTDVVTPGAALGGSPPDQSFEEELPMSDEVHEVDLDLADDVDFGTDDQTWDTPGATLENLGEEESGFQQLELGADINVGGQDSDYGDDEAYAEGEIEEEYDPIYGAEAVAEAAEGGADEEVVYEDSSEEDYAEYGESYVEAGDNWGGTEQPRRRLSLRLVAGLAAVVIVGLGGTAIVLKPEWLGIKLSPVLIDKTQVARPDLDLELSPPDVLVTPIIIGPGQEGPRPVEPTQVIGPEPTPPEVDPNPPEVDPTPPEVDPTPDVAVQTTPGQTDPTPPDGPEQTPPDTEPTLDPVAVSDPEWGDPGDGSTVTIEGYRPDTAKPEVQRKLQPIGEDLAVGDRFQGNEAEGLQPHPMSAGLASGDQAFAQMHNGNFFVGSVKTITPAVITLRVERGEVTLAFEELRVLGTASSPEFADIQNSRPGFVRLANKNRLVGNIMKSGENGRVSLNIESQQVVIPEDEIEEVGRGTASGVRITDDEDDAWIEQLIEQRIEKKRIAEEERGRGRAGGNSGEEPSTPR